MSAIVDEERELQARQAAWERAQASRVHQVVVATQEHLRIVRLPDLVIARGRDTVVALVSPFAKRPS